MKKRIAALTAVVVLCSCLALFLPRAIFAISDSRDRNEIITQTSPANDYRNYMVQNISYDVITAYLEDGNVFTEIYIDDARGTFEDMCRRYLERCGYGEENSDETDFHYYIQYYMELAADTDLDSGDYMAVGLQSADVIDGTIYSADLVRVECFDYEGGYINLVFDRNTAQLYAMTYEDMTGKSIQVEDVNVIIEASRVLAAELRAFENVNDDDLTEGDDAVTTQISTVEIVDIVENDGMALVYDMGMVIRITNNGFSINM